MPQRLAPWKENEGSGEESGEVIPSSENEHETRKHQCSLCGRRYKDPQGLAVHKYNDHNSKKFVCEVCWFLLSLCEY